MNELYHHGIKGQKWGVRRYQNKDGSLTAAGRKRYGENDNKSNDSQISNAKIWINNKLNKRVSDLKGEVDPELASTAATFLTMIGVSTIAAFYNHRKNVKNDNARFFELKDDSEFKSFSDIPKIKKKMTAEENMKVVNPGFPDEPGSTQNCTFCTVAMAMREKGYDVTANKIDKGFLGQNFIKNTFNTKLKTINTGTFIHKSEKIVTELSKQGDGAYGYLGVQWSYPYSGGHAVFWKNDAGRVRIFDGQDGTEYNIKNASNNTFFNSINLSNVQYARLDNVEPTENVLGLIKRRKE